MLGRGQQWDGPEHRWVHRQGLRVPHPHTTTDPLAIRTNTEPEPHGRDSANLTRTSARAYTCERVHACECARMCMCARATRAQRHGAPPAQRASESSERSKGGERRRPRRERRELELHLVEGI